ncbi:MAG: hypothetical protein ABI592_08025 [Acidobacteriota bacterium]
MIFGLLLSAWLTVAPGPAAPSSPGGPSRIVLRTGTEYLLKEPPRISGTRVIFTTTDGKTFSMDEKEIDSIGAAPRTAVAPKRYDVEDSTQLGAIARQQRDARGKTAEVAPRKPRPPRSAKSSKRPRMGPTAPARPRS